MQPQNGSWQINNGRVARYSVGSDVAVVAPAVQIIQGLVRLVYQLRKPL